MARLYSDQVPVIFLLDCLYYSHTIDEVGFFLYVEERLVFEIKLSFPMLDWFKVKSKVKPLLWVN